MPHVLFNLHKLRKFYTFSDDPGSVGILVAAIPACSEAPIPYWFVGAFSEMLAC
jgi:hypothetical protein